MYISVLCFWFIFICFPSYIYIYLFLCLSHSYIYICISFFPIHLSNNIIFFYFQIRYIKIVTKTKKLQGINCVVSEIGGSEAYGRTVGQQYR